MSGATGKQKQRNSGLVTLHGGLYSAELTKLCTHLVISRVSNLDERIMSPKEM